MCVLIRIVFLAALLASPTVADGGVRPNFILIFTDDQGYGDLACYGSPNIETPHLDRMAAEGIRFTSFYAAPFCGPSRAALMTGSYPPRVNMAFNHMPDATTGLNPVEITLAEILKKQGYTTMLVGKWHLGDHPQFLPLRHGFDRFYGLPYSNDMWPYNPRMPITESAHPRLIAARKRAAMTGYYGQGRPFPPGGGFPQPLPLYSGEKVLETNPDQTKLTTIYTEKALEFITENKDRPFFLYLAHAMPHVPLFVSRKHNGTSIRGLYGDVIREIDWSVGQILAKLEALGIDGGSAGPLRGGKGTSYEGGMRVPAIMRWPGRIAAGRRTAEIATTMDLLPTFARLAGTRGPTDRVIDGHDIWPLISGRPGAKSPHEAFYYFGGRRDTGGPPLLRAVRVGRWKLHFARRGSPAHGTELYDLLGDVGESRNRIDEQPDLVRRLEQMARRFTRELEANSRPIGRLAED